MSLGTFECTSVEAHLNGGWDWRVLEKFAVAEEEVVANAKTSCSEKR